MTVWQCGSLLYCIVLYSVMLMLSCSSGGFSDKMRKWEPGSYTRKLTVKTGCDWEVTAEYKKQQPVTGQSGFRQSPSCWSVRPEGPSLETRLDSMEINDVLLHNDRLVFVTVGLSTVLMESEHKIHFKMKISHFPCQNRSGTGCPERWEMKWTITLILETFQLKIRNFVKQSPAVTERYFAPLLSPEQS